MADQLCAPLRKGEVWRVPSEAIADMRNFRVNRQIYAEAKDMLFEYNTLVFSNMEQLNLSNYKQARNLNLIVDGVFWLRDLQNVITFIKSHTILFNLEIKVKIHGEPWRKEDRLRDLCRIFQALSFVNVKYNVELKAVHDEVKWTTNGMMKVFPTRLALTTPAHMWFQKFLRDLEKEMVGNWPKRQN
jgi:hypothetical protein